MNAKNKIVSIGIVGVRGYVGRELIRLLANHQSIHVEWVSSRQLNGVALTDFLSLDEYFEPVALASDHYYNDLRITTLSDEDVAAKNTDVIVLALPNGLAKSFVDKIEDSGGTRIVIDLSADFRFDDNWIYSVPELLQNGQCLNGEDSKLVKISNPGCYATAMQMALAPLVNRIIGGANCFGISGFSGAGTKPSANNDPNNLRDNILPYGLIEHLHEQEVSHQLEIPISFSPHVAEFFRGISMTIQVDLDQSYGLKDIRKIFDLFYEGKPLVKIQEAIPNIQQIVNTEECVVGGFSLSKDGKRLTLISCLDNLLKGAASQALQNIGLALR
ncbi:MAG: N-acetyl-gamma-glutamyl-phosphate reductase [Kangiellaceae bacterium]|nr:N-acetyl-gamma-glutamyl-phosphate reductase [Kangiellaceae bacterium]